MNTAKAFPAEVAARREHLPELKSPADEADKPIRHNDAGRLLGGYCSQWALQRNDKVRNALLDQMFCQWKAAQRRELKYLRKAMVEFAGARAWLETDMSNPAQAIRTIWAQEEVKNQFMSDLEQFERGSLPEFSPAQLTALNNQLDQAWRTLMHHMSAGSDGAGACGTVGREDIQETQRIWLRYCGAWVTFGYARYPEVAAHSWLALLSGRRIRQLNELLINLPKPGVVLPRALER